jgi:hypothetical protein
LATKYQGLTDCEFGDYAEFVTVSPSSSLARCARCAGDRCALHGTIADEVGDHVSLAAPSSTARRLVEHEQFQHRK